MDRLNPYGLPVMEHSISVVGERNAGTMGGYITLTQNGKVHQGFLTNYQVCCRRLRKVLNIWLFSITTPGGNYGNRSLATIDKGTTIIDLE